MRTYSEGSCDRCVSLVRITYSILFRISIRNGLIASACYLLLAVSAIGQSQSIKIPWSGYGHTAQHDSQALVPAQTVNLIVWKTHIDLNPQYVGGSGYLLIHYGSPVITISNTLIVSVKTGATNGFKFEALNATTGVTNWVRTTDFRLPPHNWTSSVSPALTPKNRLYFPGGGGTVYYCDTPDATGSTPTFGQIVFYGQANYLANSNAYLNNVYINTPITSDRYGNIFFGFQVTGSTPLGLKTGICRIDVDGTANWVAVTNLVPVTISKVALNCAPALSNDHKTLYFGVNNGDYTYGYLVALDSRTLATLASVRLKDPASGADSNIRDDATASPTIGPYGDVYYGVYDSPLYTNHARGWLLHFNSKLTQTKLPGSFGWDDTPSVIPAKMVPSYTGTSSYLLVSKYNHYVAGGGDGVHKLAILDPFTSMVSPVTGKNVMKEVLTIVAPTPDPSQRPAHPNAVKEWCINVAAVDPFTKSVFAGNEDGKLYRWDLTSNTLSQTNVLSAGLGEAYTPTLVGTNGIVYAINNATIFAIGQ